jgi:hypothetical protein
MMRRIMLVATVTLVMAMAISAPAWAVKEGVKHQPPGQYTCTLADGSTNELNVPRGQAQKGIQSGYYLDCQRRDVIQPS